MRIVQAHHSDIEQITSILSHAVSFMNASGNFQWDKHYPNRTVFENDIQRGELFKAMDMNSLAGIVCLNQDQPPEYGPLDWKTPHKALVIHRMMVAPEYHGEGIARAMFAFAEEEAKRQGFPAIRSDTNRANGAMNHLFQAFDYRFTGTIVLRENPVLFNCYEKHLRVDD